MARADSLEQAQLAALGVASVSASAPASAVSVPLGSAVIEVLNREEQKHWSKALAAIVRYQPPPATRSTPISFESILAQLHSSRRFSGSNRHR